MSCDVGLLPRVENDGMHGGGVDYIGDLDEQQLEFMNKDICILVNEKDEPIEGITKKDAHLMKNISKGFLHRAFSVFLFNSENKLLLQKRADSKITFPGYYTNTCCSHPFLNRREMIQEEYLGVKHAAVRKLAHELGIPATQVPMKELIPMRKIHYISPCEDAIWGEHEVDYILVFRGDVDLEINPNEVSAVQYVTLEEVLEMIKTNMLGEEKVRLTPWFKLIVKNYLKTWWENLSNIESLSDPEKIDNYCTCNQKQ